MTPMVVDLPIAKPRAAGFGRKLYLAMAASTALLRSALTCAVPLMMRDTVLIDTPAARATTCSVGGDVFAAAADLAGFFMPASPSRATSARPRAVREFGPWSPG